VTISTTPLLHDAILLIGPTGSGKTPLGEYAEQHGLDGRRCVHFDFGQALRAAAGAPVPPNGLTPADIAFIRHVLNTGALLEDDRFPIAEAILKHFINTRTTSTDDIIVLNGLPRHIGQARRLAPLLTIRRVLHLQCAPETVYDRIRLNSGGDRTGRRDDQPDDIRRKLELFNQRTAPLLDDFRQHGIPVITCESTLHSTPASLWSERLHRPASPIPC